jgi:tetratricopeptide (TPR) repeat protein
MTHVVLYDWSSEVVANAWQRSYELATQAANVTQQCRALVLLDSVATNRGDWHKARQFAEQALALAEKTGDSLLLNERLSDYGKILYHAGDLIHALGYLKRHPGFSKVAGLLTGEGRDDLLPYPRLGKCLWLLGFPDQALACGRKALEAKQQSMDFMQRLPNLAFTGMLYAFLRDVPTVQRLGQELTAISTEYDFPFCASVGQMLTGWAMAQQGEPQRGLPLAQQSIDDHRKRGNRMFEPHWQAMLAETLALAGELEAALDEVTGALTYAEECGNRYWNAHLLKLKGDFLYERSAADQQVEDWYQRALTTARQQSARSLELRVAISLSRLWQHQGRGPAAYQLLREIYDWFTEGIDTADLQEAKRLLAALASS